VSEHLDELLRYVGFDEADGARPDFSAHADYAELLDRRSAELLDQWASQLRGKISVPVTTTARIGWPGAEILAALDRDSTVDLVVMGSHGRTGIKRVLLGSVAEKIVRHARCPVLVARRRK
jgi:nucleotide-binding universal stress UspA family protein